MANRTIQNLTAEELVDLLATLRRIEAQAEIRLAELRATEILAALPASNPQRLSR